MEWLYGAVPGILLGFLGGRYVYHRILAAREAEAAAQRGGVLKKAREEADRLVKDAQVRAKDEILTRREEFERDAERQRAEIREIELIVTKKEESFDRRDERFGGIADRKFGHGFETIPGAGIPGPGSSTESGP